MAGKKDSSSRKKAGDHVLVSLRVPRSLKSRLQDCAAEEHRTLTGEIVKRLEDSLQKEAAAA